MRRSFFVFLFACILASAAYADQGDLSFGGDFGQVGFTGPSMGNYGTNGFGYGGYLSYAASDLFDLDMNLIYSPHSENGNSAAATYGTLALKFGMTFDQLLPYLTAGIGLYHNSVNFGGVGDSATAFGFNVGGGMDVDLGKYLRIGLLVRYHPVFGKSFSSGRPGGVDDIWDALFKIGVLFKTGVQGGWD
jgi:opacity protein-like surface antigen